jgi:hypothetical protein
MTPRLLWMSDQPDAETSHNTHKRQTDIHPRLQQDLNLQSERWASSCRPTCPTVWPLGSPFSLYTLWIILYHGSTATLIDVPLLKSSLQNVLIIQSYGGNIFNMQSADYYIWNSAKVFIIPTGCKQQSVRTAVNRRHNKKRANPNVPLIVNLLCTEVSVIFMSCF